MIMKKYFIILFFIVTIFNKSFAENSNDIYKKIDLFSEVLEKN